MVIEVSDITALVTAITSLVAAIGAIIAVVKGANTAKRVDVAVEKVEESKALSKVNAGKIDELHVLSNAMKDELVAAKTEAAHAQGVIAGVDIAKKDVGGAVLAAVAATPSATPPVAPAAPEPEKK